jgi:hypothetical protein
VKFGMERSPLAQKVRCQLCSPAESRDIPVLARGIRMRVIAFYSRIRELLWRLEDAAGD